MTDPVKDHVTHLEILREEMELVTRRKNDLEKKIEQLIVERDQLNAVLEESSDKILMLEKQTREQDCQVHPSGNGKVAVRGQKTCKFDKILILAAVFPAVFVYSLLDSYQKYLTFWTLTSIFSFRLDFKPIPNQTS